MATKKTQKIYEVSFHLIPDVAENADTKFEEIQGKLSSGEIIGSERPESVALAYTIRHNVRKQDGSYSRYDDALFGSVKFRATPAFVEEFRRTLQADNDILRFLILESIEGTTRIGETLPGEIEEAEADKKKTRTGKRVETKKTKGATMKKKDTVTNT